MVLRKSLRMFLMGQKGQKGRKGRKNRETCCAKRGFSLRPTRSAIGLLSTILVASCATVDRQPTSEQPDKRAGVEEVHDQPIKIVIKERSDAGEVSEPQGQAKTSIVAKSLEESTGKSVGKSVKKPAVASARKRAETEVDNPVNAQVQNQVKNQIKKEVEKRISAEIEKKIQKEIKKEIKKEIVRKVENEIKKEVAEENRIEESDKRSIQEGVERVVEEEIKFESLDQLPLAIGGDWYLDGGTLSEERGGCTINSRAATIEDGHGGTPLEFQISMKEIKAKTRSNIDISYENDGLIIDQQSPIEADFVRNEQTVIFKIEPQTFIEKLEEAKKLSVHLGFWPTWPVTQTYQTTFDVTDLNRAGQWLSRCNSLIDSERVGQ